ncbi:MAG TPA: AAA family ATPase, partial [Nocardioides sp.]|nr:AAA family ATPase [Nocardioides sp.]
LASRFRTTIEFEDYTDDELVAILEHLAERADYEVLPEAVARFREVLGRTPRGDGFGNGRFSRNALEAAIGHHAWRLRQIDTPSIDQLRQLVARDFDVEPMDEPDLQTPTVQSSDDGPDTPEPASPEPTSSGGNP